MTASPSLFGRAVLAVVLMIGFYLLALGMAAGLFYIPYAEMAYAQRLHIKLALACLIGGLAILWSVLPRFDRFEPPGPQLTPAQHPELFKEIEDVARSVGQAMPAEVYLVPDVNAWVTQRGGLMGFGSRRVMGLGLPLMRMLTRSQFRAVLAHEFGHYHSGDTRLGPWIYKTRGAIERTLQSLGDSLLQLPFLAYGKMFLRITHAISRRQEFVADELAARAVGSKPLIDGLRTVHGVGPAFQAYWTNECAPVLNAGFRPPLTEGFQRFVEAAPVAAAIDRQLQQELQAGQANPYDTHPPLKERIAAVTALPAGEPGPDDPPASTLLRDVPVLEHQLVEAMAGPDAAGKLKPIDWGEVGLQVYLPQWTALVKANASALAGLKPEFLPEHATQIRDIARLCVDPNGIRPQEDMAEPLARAVLGAALTLALRERGGQVEAVPGLSIAVTVNGLRVEPFDALQALAEGKLSAAAWQEQCRQSGIAGVNLGQVSNG